MGASSFASLIDEGQGSDLLPFFCFYGGSISEVKIAIWNVQWAKPESKRGLEIGNLLRQGNFDIVCMTEAFATSPPEPGYVVTSGADYGYSATGSRRKVVLWSRNPWTTVTLRADEDFPSGRLVEGVTETPLGSLTVIGVCIPWRDAHVRTGRKDRAPWEDHLAFLTALQRRLVAGETRRVVLGDFNQRIPNSGCPARVAAALAHTMASSRVCTSGPLAPLDRQSIDHAAHSADLVAREVRNWSEFTEDGSKLSDHFGLQALLGRQS